MVLELKRRHIAQCYLATRQHPTLGLLLKVGSSINPQMRIKDLRATPALSLWMPYAHESAIKLHLQKWRAWPNDRSKWINPVFDAQSEWFLWNATSRGVLNAYLALQAAKRSPNGTLEHLFGDLILDTQPDPEEGNQ
jgi:hypothetical protein